MTKAKALPTASPRWATQRNPERPTYGPEALQVARGLGFGGLLPWQQDVFDTALEYDPDTGELFYRSVVITVPRQSGKTAGVLVALVHRMTLMAERMLPVLQQMGRPDLEQRAYYTAQTGSDARAKLRYDWLPIINRSMWDDYLVAVKLSNGHELLMFSDGPEHEKWGWRGTVQPVATTEGAGHGRVTDFGLLDEVWEDGDDRREQALMPGMNTRPSPQLWIVSTMGTEQSHYLNRKVADGRLAVEAGVDHTTLYVEYSAPDDADPDNEEQWHTYMPALGHTTPVAAIRAARMSMKDDEFQRAYMNRMVVRSDKVLPIEAFMRKESQTVELGDPIMYSIDANPNRTHAALAVSDGRAVEVIENYSSMEHCASDAIRAALGEMGRPGAVAIDEQSPIASKVPQLERAGVSVVTLKYNEVKTATANLFDAIVTPSSDLAVVPNESLRAAVEGAERKAVGDRFVWSRRKPTVDITPLNAVTFARHAAREAPGVWSWMMN